VPARFGLKAKKTAPGERQNPDSEIFAESGSDNKSLLEIIFRIVGTVEGVLGTFPFWSVIHREKRPRCLKRQRGRG
jgi:hypothetical protein